MKTQQALWDYACALYQHNDTQAICLRLQDDYGVNVPWLLFVCWVLVSHKEVADSVLINAYERVQAVDKPVITPLRHVRRSLKQIETRKEWQVLRQQLADIELAAEQLLLNELEAILHLPLEASAMITSLSDAVQLVYPHLGLVNSDAIRQLDIARLEVLA